MRLTVISVAGLTMKAFSPVVKIISSLETVYAGDVITTLVIPGMSLTVSTILLKSKL